MSDRLEQFRYSGLEKYNTFFLQYYKTAENKYVTHTVRPCVSTYEQTKTDKICQLDSTVIHFRLDVTIPEILLECAIRGISIDYIEILIHDGDSYSHDKVIQVIDCHKEDVTKKFKEIESLQFYVANNVSKKKKDEPFKFLVIDRFAQSSKVKFLNGKYENSGIIAGFREQARAVRLCKELNDKSKENFEFETT